MPSNRRNTRKPLDTDVSQKLEEFEFNFCKYVDKAMPKKFHDTFVKQILLALGNAAEAMLRGLRKDSKLFTAEKLHLYEDALGALDYVSTRLNRLNDMASISNETKATLDMKLYDIKEGLERLSNSLRKCAVSQFPNGTPRGEADGLEGCQTGQEND